MRLTPVESSALRAVGYDPLKRLLEIQFTTGRIYRYFDVAPGIHAALMAAESKGAYFNAAVRDRYDCAIVAGRR